MAKLIVLVASTRPGRVGSTVGKWLAEAAKQHGKFEVELVELADMHLPVYDEPNHPATGIYVHEHTRRWSEKVASADAFAIALPEYNFSMPSSLLNALTFLLREWAYKPVGFASYGGISGGLRAVQMAKQVMTTFRMFPIYEAVVFPNVAGHLNDNGELLAGDIQTTSANAMFDELSRVSDALAPLRA